MIHLCKLLLTLTVPEGVPGSVTPKTCPGHISPQNGLRIIQVFCAVL